MTGAGQRARFTGAPLSFVRMQFWRALLTLLSLGFHRFWWRTANRRWLWERTTLDGDPLEYRGRGIGKLVGFLLAALVVVPLGILGLVAWRVGGTAPDTPAAVVAALVALVTVPALLVFLTGYAVWRARRDLPSRTAWRGIRGGVEGSPAAHARLSFGLGLAIAVPTVLLFPGPGL